jgi:putative transposase
MSKIWHLNIEGYPVFASAVTKERSKIFAVERNAFTLIETINFCRDKGWIYLVSFVIMPDHLHLLVVPRGNKNISQIMQSIKGYSAYLINRLSASSGSIWQRGFKDFTIPGIKVLEDKIRYIHNNPVVRGLVDYPEEYRYSSANEANVTDLGVVL